MAKRKRSWEEDLAEVDQKDNESLNEDNESLNEDIAMDSGSSTKTEDGPNALSESNCQKGKCIVAVAQKLRIQHEYMHLVGAINGERYHFPGVGTPPAFLVPAYHLNGEQYLAQELIGKYLIALERCQDGFQIKRQECPTSDRAPPLLSAGKVCGFLDHQGKQRRCGNLAAMADESGAVQVHFGDDPLSEEVEEMEPPDVSDICTPPSDDQRVTQSE